MHRAMRAILVVSFMLVAVTQSETQTDSSNGIPFHATFSGGGMTSEIDTDGDGTPAAWGSVTLQGNLGVEAAQVVVEFAPPQPATCPSGNEGMELTTLIVGRGFFTFETGHLLLFEYASGMGCIDQVTGVLSIEFVGNFTGGTGDYVGATGPLMLSGTATTLVADATGRGFFH